MIELGGHLYRGKAINRDPEGYYRSSYKNGEWVFGLLSKYEPDFDVAEMTDETGISRIDVDIKTIGKVTTINGVRFGEGDIVETSKNKQGTEKAYGTVKFGRFEEGDSRYFYIGYYIEWYKCPSYRKSVGWWATERDLKIVGNIYDNPDFYDNQI